MGGHISTNQTTQLLFTQDDETWIVDPGVSIAVNGDDAVFSSWRASTLVNKGQISASGVGNVGVLFVGPGYDGVIKNSGKISSDGGIAIRIDTNFVGVTTVVKNLKGGILESPTSQVTLLCDDGNETVVNAGRIGSLNATVQTTVHLGEGDDHFTNFQKIGKKVVSGTVLGVIQLGAGNDTFLGGRKIEVVRDDGGSDTYKFGGGNDTYFATGAGASDGNDIVAGGSGIDTFSAAGSLNSVFINLDSKVHGYAIVSVAANTAQGDDVSGGLINSDKVIGFENVFGGEANDIIFGNNADNELNGFSGADRLFGFGGNDLLRGSAGSDLLVGGKGRDTLLSDSKYFNDGSGDTFQYLSLKDSTPAKEGRDVIFQDGFADGRDIIHLSTIDANAKNGGATNEAFQFLGVDVAFGSAPGGLRVITKDFGWLVQGEVNGDKKADFAIQVNDPTHTISWSDADFVL